MIKSNCLLTIGILVCFSINCFAQNAPKFVNEFLNIGVGAEAHGMFGSVAATTDDITAAYWNPAGLAYIEADYQGAAMHASWFGGIANYDYFAFGKKLGDRYDDPSFASVSIIRMGIDGIPNTINLIGPDGSINYNNVTEFSAADYAALFSYGRQLEDLNISFGATAKIIYRRIGSFGSAWGFGFDAGMIYQYNGLKIGLMGRDITTTVNAWSFDLDDRTQQVFANTGNDIPVSSTEVALPKIVFATAYEGNISSFGYLVEADFRFSSDGTQSGVASGNIIAIDPTVGLELNYDKVAFLRMGVGNIQRILNENSTSETKTVLQPNVGVGVNLGQIQIDYALTNLGSTAEALVSHIFSVKIDLYTN